MHLLHGMHTDKCILYVIYIHTHTHIYIYFSMLYYNKSLKKKYWIEFCKQWEALKVLVNGRIRPSGTFVFVYFFLNVIFRIKLLIFFFLNFVLLLTSYVWDHFCCHHIGRLVFSLCNFMRKLPGLMDASFSWRMYSWQWNWDSKSMSQTWYPIFERLLGKPKDILICLCASRKLELDKALRPNAESYQPGINEKCETSP